MELICWFGVIVLFAIGLIGTALPIFPGTIIIFAAALLHRVVLGPEKSLGWVGIGVLALLTVASFAIDLLAGHVGAKHFGATRWGTFGAIVGGLVGIFFGIAGIFVGPLIGVFAGELIGGKRLVQAGRAGWGNLLGNFAGMIAKLLIALAMITIFLVNAPSPF